MDLRVTEACTMKQYLRCLAGNWIHPVVPAVLDGVTDKLEATPPTINSVHYFCGLYRGALTGAIMGIPAET